MGGFFSAAPWCLLVWSLGAPPPPWPLLVRPPVDLHVVFGHVTEGMDVIKDLEQYATGEEGDVTTPIEIVASGCAD